MKINYDGVEIEAADLVRHLETYAKSVMCRMRNADPEFADCWTACVITFEQIQPEFQFGSREDLSPDDGILVLCPYVEE